MISIVIPTITGREETLERTLRSYQETQEDATFQTIIVKDKPNWPAACNSGYLQADFGIIHFTSDDLTAEPGWWQPAIKLLEDADELPAPRVFDYSRNGKFANAEDGEDGSITHFTRIPIMRRDQWERIGPWPEIPYYADLWLSEKARAVHGIETRMVYGYDFVHHWSGIGRLDSKDNLDDSGIELQRLRKEWEEP